MSYNLNEDVQEYFEFVLGGHTYRMAYPTTEDIEKAQTIKDDLAKANEWLDKYISAVSEGAPPFREAIAKANIKVLQRFNEMIETEFSSPQAVTK